MAEHEKIVSVAGHDLQNMSKIELLESRNQSYPYIYDRAHVNVSISQDSQ
jgi:hypothetical protein